MNGKSFLAIVSGMNLVVILAAAFFFFSGTDFSAGQSEKGRKIGASYMAMDQTYYEVLHNAIRSVVEKKGDTLLVRNPAMDAKKQAEQIDEMIDEGIEALFVAPVDWKEITPALQRAKERGILVVAVDSAPEREDLTDCQVTSDNYDAGVQLANFLMGQKRFADIAVLEQPGVLAYMERIQGFTDAIAENPRYRIVGTYSYKGQMDSAMEAVGAAIGGGSPAGNGSTENVPFDTIFAVNDTGAIGAIAELERNGMSGISILGVDGSPEGKLMIGEKRMLATAAQYPTELGRQSAQAMYTLLEGGTCERRIKISVKLISRYTIGSYDTEKWQ